MLFTLFISPGLKSKGPLGHEGLIVQPFFNQDVGEPQSQSSVCSRLDGDPLVGFGGRHTKAGLHLNEAPSPPATLV